MQNCFFCGKEEEEREKRKELAGEDGAWDFSENLPQGSPCGGEGIKAERRVTERRRFRKQGEECHSLCFVRAAGRLSNESAGMASDDVNALSCREKKRAICRKRRDGPEKDVFRLSENHSAYWLLLGRNGVVIALLVGGGSVFHLRRTAAVR